MSNAPCGVLELVERFERNRQAYRTAPYNETQVRREFIDPLFDALGWDVHNKSGYAEPYKDVIHEDAIKVGGSTEAPDYCFRVGGRRIFFVEAKRPSVNIAGDISPAYQLRRYAWSAKLPLSVLTDFEEFAVYDCRVRPGARDKPSLARTMYLRYDAYADNWDRIAAIFSKQAVLEGSFDKYVLSSKKRGTAEVDTEFLKEIETWRDALARNVALRNPSLDVRELNFAVQKTIDRIIFLRMCEDRGVENYATLQGLIGGPQIYPRLLEIFRAADDRYNSGLFHFNDERGRPEAPDTLTPGLKIDDAVLKSILRSLYYPHSPYEFSVLPADILGNVYEQFLGKVIHLTAGHRARVEEKPEVKKAGGVYYTPKYIVDYIVAHTVGRLVGSTGVSPVELGGTGVSSLRDVSPVKDKTISKTAMPQKGKSPRQISRLRILDPACGSGSFLVGAYRRLLDYHRDWYVAPANGGPEKHRKQVYQGAGGAWYLTTQEKKRILVNNIYGVDIDAQAVEVTKLNLLLCVLENENQNTLSTQLKMFHERALPDLAANIKCGNSLIGHDFYEEKQLALFDEETRRRVNAFDWKAEFPEVFNRKNPGFDAVIGNPPYVLLQTLSEREVEEYLRRKYDSATYKVDTYQVFLEKSCNLTREHGYFGLIVPNTFLRNKFAVALRNVLLEGSEIVETCLFDFPVFAQASVDTLIVVGCRRKKPQPKHRVRVVRSRQPGEFPMVRLVSQHDWQARDDKNFEVELDDVTKRLLGKMERSSVQLGTFATAYFGIQTRGRTRYVSLTRKGKDWKPVIDGTNVGRYSLSPNREFVCIHPSAIKSGGDRNVYEQDRIVVRQIGRSPFGTLVPGGIYSLNTVYNIYFTRPVEYDLRFILGVVLSRTIAWYWGKRFFDQKRTFPKIKKEPLLSLPIPAIDFSEDAGKAIHDRIVDLVVGMLSLHKQLPAARTPEAKTRLQRQIDATDKQIAKLVYDLYDLTEDEIAIVEGETS